MPHHLSTGAKKGDLTSSHQGAVNNTLCLFTGTERDLTSSHQSTVNNTVSVYRHREILQVLIRVQSTTLCLSIDAERSYKFSSGYSQQHYVCLQAPRDGSDKLSSGYSQQRYTICLQVLRKEILQVLIKVQSTILYCLSTGAERDLTSSHQGTVNNTVSVYRR